MVETTTQSSFVAAKLPAFTAPAPEPEVENRILVVGGSYGGLSAVVNLLTLAYGGEHRPGIVTMPPLTGKPLKKGIRITMVDEKDGFCEYLLSRSVLNK
jgi:hypothetical protein